MKCRKVSTKSSQYHLPSLQCSDLHVYISWTKGTSLQKKQLEITGYFLSNKELVDERGQRWRNSKADNREIKSIR